MKKLAANAISATVRESLDNPVDDDIDLVDDDTFEVDVAQDDDSDVVSDDCAERGEPEPFCFSDKALGARIARMSHFVADYEEARSDLEYFMSMAQDDLSEDQFDTLVDELETMLGPKHRFTLASM